MWYRIKTAPNDGKPVLCCFKGQFKWVYFICDAFGENTKRDGVKPDYWQPIEECSEE